MARLTTLPVPNNLSNLQQFYHRRNPENVIPSITKLLVDGTFIPINTAILSIWSSKFDQLRDDDDMIVLDGFSGSAQEVMDCLELMHGHQVEISFKNIQVGYS